MGRKFITYNGVIVGNGGLTLLSTETDTPTPPSFTNTKSILLDGVDDYVDCGDNDNLSFGDSVTDSPFSISAWVKMTDATKFRIVTKAGSGSNDNEYVLITSASDQLFLQLYDSSTSNKKNRYYTTPLTSFEGQWIHIVGTYDGRGGSTAYNGIKLYLNGTRVDDASGGGGTYVAMHNTTALLEIGKLSTSTANGLIDEVAVFNSELSASDVTNIYDNGVPNDISSLSPLSWWRCGDGDTAPTLTDNGSGGNNGTMTNFSTFSTDVPKFNTKSIALDGVDDYINVADNSNLSFGNGTTDSPFSISGWIKMDDISGFRLLNKYVGSTYEYSFGTGAAGNLQLYLLDSSSQYRARLQSTFLNTGQWYHIASTYDGRGGINAQDGIKIYVDGVRVDDTSVSVGSYIAMTNTTVPVYIGKLNTSYTDGNIDEVAIFNSELSQSDITSIYNGGTPNDISSLSPLSWWRCGDGDTSPTLTDNGSGGNDGTMTNFSTFSTDVPTIPFSTKSIALDGVDDYVSVANNTTIARTQTISYSIWVNLVDGSARQYIIGNQKSSNGGTGLSIESGGFLLFQVADGTNDSYFNSKVTNFTTYAPNNTWNHILATFDGANAKIFINGILRNNWSVTTPYTISNYSNFWIGRRNANTSQLTNGKLDEIALFNTDQSANASTIYNGGVPNDISSLSPVSWWRCGDGDTSPTLTDNGSASNDGTMTNFTTFSTDVPT